LARRIGLAVLLSSVLTGPLHATHNLISATGPHIGGKFGPPVTWPIIAIHAVLMPDGRILSYGTNQAGKQGAQLVYDIWDPALGTSTNAHLVLQHTTLTDIFCSQ
jgi:hypothetical protein